MFSVVIPVYNHKRFLREAVKSALASELVSEVLLCDDGSTDGSDRLCHNLSEEFQGKVLNYSDKPTRNKGAHVRINQLCMLASQPWIRILNSDDFFIPGSFDSLRLFISIHKPSFVSGTMLICDDNGSFIGTKRGVFDPEYPFPDKIIPESLLKNDDIRRYLLNQNFIATTSNMAFTRELFEKIGGFGDFRYAHDLDFALRATMSGICLCVASPLVVYRIHGSNTISELSPHMDGEITRLYANLLSDFPEIEVGEVSLRFLAGNRHIAPFPAAPARNLPLSDPAPPLFLSPLLPTASIPNVLLALGAMDYDFVLVSRSLAEPPAVGAGLLGEGLAGLADAVSVMNSSKPSNRPLAGRLLRCPPREPDITVYPATDLLPDGAELQGAAIYLWGKRHVTSRVRGGVLADLARKLREWCPPGLPVVFVLPIFLAVGGVERNTLEVIRNLRDRYRFVVITTEFLSERQGSLHWQLEELDVPIFDLAEIADQSHHLDLLASLAALLPPQLVWICNGSPWLVDNAVSLRRLFANVPIVDQEVYDTEVGWIEHYGDKGIQSFDHFIAINSKIHTKFLETLRIPSHRTTLIYPALNDGPVREARLHRFDKADSRQELGVPEGTDKVFIFVGRLTEQKKPLSFLDLVNTAQESHPSAYFLMVGDGELAAKCDDFIYKNELLNVRRIPYHPSPPELMRLADGMIITSIYEGLPIAMLEALAIGIPVLATDVGDIRPVLEEYGTGIVSDVIDDEGNAKLDFEHVNEFITNLQTFKEAAVSNAEKVLQRFQAANVSQKYDELFFSKLSSKPIN